MHHITEQQELNRWDFHFVNKWNVSLFPSIVFQPKIGFPFLFQKLNFIWERARAWCLKTKHKEQCADMETEQKQISEKEIRC